MKIFEIVIWVLVTIASFVIFWPLGSIMLVYLLYNKTPIKQFIKDIHTIAENQQKKNEDE